MEKTFNFLNNQKYILGSREKRKILNNRLINNRDNEKNILTFFCIFIFLWILYFVFIIVFNIIILFFLSSFLSIIIILLLVNIIDKKFNESRYEVIKINITKNFNKDFLITKK